MWDSPPGDMPEKYLSVLLKPLMVEGSLLLTVEGHIDSYAG